jgi:DDE domain
MGRGSWPGGPPRKDGASAPSGAGSVDTATTYPSETSRTKNLKIELNNIVEQDHRAVKRITRSMLGFKAFDAAQDTLVRIELMHMIKKQQLMVEAGDEGLTAAEQFYSLAA